ncbi:FG-GAP repeat domain-containing protein [Streptomyces sp. NPDC087219]|uniref:FG-GAP repeat domain-containing protein n=1 Tax=Streptomyces sp. NPDC087219 TaxID=3365770 RepID=UPI00382B9B80
MSKRMRRGAAMTGVAGLLAMAGVTAGAGVAAAEDLKMSGYDAVAAPGSVPRFHPVVESGTTFWGKVVIAVGRKPLTGPAGDGAGVPQGYRIQNYGCDQPTGLVGVYVCDPQISHNYPDVVVPKDAKDTTLYWGFTYLPRGGDLAAAIESARTAGARPADATSGTGRVIVKSAASAARNTVAFDVPDVPAGGTVRQQLRVHAVDAGRVTLSFKVAEGQLWGWPGKIPLGNVTTDSGASCSAHADQLHVDAMNLDCRVEPGDHTIGYELTGAANQKALRLQAQSRYDIYDVHAPDSDVIQLSTPFTVLGDAALPRHSLLARDTSGRVWEYYGTGKASAPFYSRSEVGPGWQTYDTITALSPYSQSPYYRPDVKPSAVTRGLGDLVARDASGTLWYYDRQIVDEKPYAARVKIGSGWNAYDQLAGAGDVDRDEYVDLVARDKAGALWLYKGTGSFTGARFMTRVRVGEGWGAYGRLAGGADVTGDGRADLMARDAAGVLWLYKGTGSGTAPYAGRTRVGAGWNAYDQIVVAGDLTDDGKADAVARDTAGMLWLYKGTGSATAPFAGRTRVGTGWNAYNRVF